MTYTPPYWDHDPYWVQYCTCPGPTMTDLSCPIHMMGEDDDDDY